MPEASAVVGGTLVKKLKVMSSQGPPDDGVVNDWPKKNPLPEPSVPAIFCTITPANACDDASIAAKPSDAAKARLQIIGLSRLPAVSGRVARKVACAWTPYLIPQYSCQLRKSKRFQMVALYRSGRQRSHCKQFRQQRKRYHLHSKQL